MMKRLLVLLAGMLCCLSSMRAQQAFADSIAHRLQRQRSLFPQEKVSLHVDRTVFLPGDSICLKVYVVDAATLVPVLQSQYVYVELLNEQNRCVQRKRLIASNNLYMGYINLPAEQKPGVYHLWAYSLYSAQVKNYDCLVPIQVGSEQLQAVARKPVPQLRFFPEGGYLVEGAACMVAFEAATSEGDSLQIPGEVVNKAGQTVARFATRHCGLGVFPLAVEAGEQYTAVCHHANGKKYSFPLPKPRADAACLQCRYRENDIRVNVNCGAGFASRPLYLLVHCRGQLVSMQQVKPGTVYHLSPHQLPAGVNSLLLLDEEAQVLSERLVFSCNPAARLPLTVESSADAFGLRDSIPVELSLAGLAEEEFAFLSISVTDDGITHGRHSPSLWSQLLLTSDLQGFIPQPDDYFMPSPQTEKLDLLMMVNGWRRYDIPSVLKGEYARPTVQHEYSQQVKGRVRAVFKNQPVDSVTVTLAIMKQKYVGETTTDSLGRFEFHDLNYSEDADAFVYALRQKNRRCMVEIDKQKGPFAPDKKVMQRVAKWMSWQDVDEELLNFYARDSHLLEEVVVKAKAPKRLNGTPTLSMDRQQIVEGDYPSFAMLLLCTNRLSVDYGSGTIKADVMDLSGVDRLQRERSLERDMKTKSAEVKLYINGMYIPGVTFEDIDLEEVDRIDLYQGHHALALGLDSVRGGVLNVTMRNGFSRSTGSIFNNKVVRLEGYQEPVEYYFPRYPKGAKPSSMSPDVRRTIYWNPYLRIAKGTPLHLDFFSADIPTRYTVRVEGITSRGRIVDGQLGLRIGEKE